MLRRNPIGRAALLILLGILATPARPVFATPGPPSLYSLTVAILDGGAATSTAARIRVIGSDGQDYYPLPAASHFYHEAYLGHRYFYADGQFTVQVPTGQTVIWVSKGFEYWAYRDTIDLVANEGMAGTHAIVLQRFADMPALGWRSGDTHVHRAHGGDSVYVVDQDALFMMQRAEDVHVVNSLETEVEFTGTIDPRSTANHLYYVGGEYRSAFWGHLDVLGVNSLPYLFCCSQGQPAFPMNVDLVRDARSRGGMVFYAHPITVSRGQIGITDQGWPSVGHGRELPIDVALGTIDALDIWSYSNMNRIELGTWYDLLNHGFRIPASAGTDASVNRFSEPPLGGYRVYAQVGPGAFTHQDWLEAVRRGESYVTNGPLIRSFLVDGHPAGTVLTKTKQAAMATQVSFNATSQWPITYVVVIVNGVAQQIFVPQGNPLEMSGQINVSLTRSSWVAIRVHATWSNPGPFFTIGTILDAHSNPVYVDVPGLPPTFSSADPLYYVDWVEDVLWMTRTRGMWNAPADQDTVEARLSWAGSILLSRTSVGRSGVGAPDGSPAAGSGHRALEVHVRTENAARGITFRFDGASSAPETFDLFDVNGKPVLTRRILQLDASPTAWTWKFASAGRPLASGIYLARFRGADWNAGTKIRVP